MHHLIISSSDIFNHILLISGLDPEYLLWGLRKPFKTEVIHEEMRQCVVRVKALMGWKAE